MLSAPSFVTAERTLVSVARTATLAWCCWSRYRQDVLPSWYVAVNAAHQAAAASGTPPSESSAETVWPGVESTAEQIRIYGACPARGPDDIACLKHLRHDGRHFGVRNGELVSWRRVQPDETREGFEL